MNEEELRRFLSGIAKEDTVDAPATETEKPTAAAQTDADVEKPEPELKLESVPVVSADAGSEDGSETSTDDGTEASSETSTEANTDDLSFDDLLRKAVDEPDGTALAKEEVAESALKPLILPGFMPEPQSSLPPVFSADTEPETDSVSSADEEEDEQVDLHPQLIDLPETQPHDVILDDEEEYDEEDGNSELLALLDEATVDTDTEPVQLPQAAAPTAASTDATQPQVPASTPVNAQADLTPSPIAQQQEFAGLAKAAAAAAATSPLPEQQAVRASRNSRASRDGSASRDGYEKISVTGGENTGVRKAVPWIIVAAGSVVALVAAMIILNLNNSVAPEPAEPTVPTTVAPTTPTPTVQPEPTAEPEPEPEPSEDPDEAPDVDMGPNPYALEISQWGLVVDRSSRFGGSTPYTMEGGDERAMFELPLAEELPESCAAARTGWGLKKVDDTTLEVVRPEPRCSDTDAAAVYDTIWGLMDKMAKSARKA